MPLPGPNSTTTDPLDGWSVSTRLTNLGRPDGHGGEVFIGPRYATMFAEIVLAEIILFVFNTKIDRRYLYFNLESIFLFYKIPLWFGYKKSYTFQRNLYVNLQSIRLF
jgi:hypothetical protein